VSKIGVYFKSISVVYFTALLQEILFFFHSKTIHELIRSYSIYKKNLTLTTIYIFL